MTDISYRKHSIESALINWVEIEKASEEMLVIVRADITLAIGFLSVTDQYVANRVRVQGDFAFGPTTVWNKDGSKQKELAPVAREDFNRVINALFRRLNILGLGGTIE